MKVLQVINTLLLLGIFIAVVSLAHSDFFLVEVGNGLLRVNVENTPLEVQITR